MTDNTGLPVIVGVDGSTAGERALEWGADEAQRRAVGLVVVHAAGIEGVHRLSAETATTVAAELTGFGEQLLEQAVNRLAVRNPAVDVVAELAHEPAAAALIDRSIGAALLVLGRGGRGPVRRFLLGSIAHRVVSHAACPAVVIGPDTGSDQYTVVVGVSLSAGGRAALRLGAYEAELRGARLLGLRSAADAGRTRTAIGHLLMTSAEQWQAAEQHILQTWLDNARAEFPSLTIKARLTQLPLDLAIAEHTHDASLLVLGSPAARHVGTPRLGPVVAQAIHHAHCPVAVTAHPVRADVPQPSVVRWATELQSAIS